MKVAFYAPLNPTDGRTPSGDRLIARNLAQALTNAGHTVFTGSRLRSFDKFGDAGRQAKIEQLAARIARRFVRRVKFGVVPRPDIWLTYHLYHKAPDWVGPAVADALSIPYAVVEASYAGKQAAGPWAAGHAAVVRALHRADLVLGLSSADRAGVEPLLRPDARYLGIRPFIDMRPFVEASPRRPQHAAELRRTLTLPATTPILLAVGMMRNGAKLASYRLLGDALSNLLELDWVLLVAGDGPAKADVQAALRPIAERVSWLGRVGSDSLPATYAAADLFVWPGIKEALGMCYLEAQGAGTPVVGARSLGIPDVVADGTTGLLPKPGNAPAFAAAIRLLLEDPERRLHMADAAARYARENHDLASSGRRFAESLAALVRFRSKRPVPIKGLSA